MLVVETAVRIRREHAGGKPIKAIAGDMPMTTSAASEEPVAEGTTSAIDVNLEQLRPALDSNPELLLADAERNRAEAGIRLAQSEKRPDFGVSATYGRRNPEFGDVLSVMGSVTLPIFTDRRQNPPIAAAAADAAAALAERDDRLRAITARFEADLALWRSAARQ